MFFRKIKKNTQAELERPLALMAEAYNLFTNNPDFIYKSGLPQIITFAKEIYPSLEEIISSQTLENNITHP